MYDDDFDVDLSEAAGNLDGVYEVVVTDVDRQTSKAGNDMFVFKVDVVADEHGVERSEVESLSEYCAITRKALWKVEQVLVALGLAKPGGKVKFKREQAVGRRALVFIQMEARDGRNYPTIKEWRAHPKGFMSMRPAVSTPPAQHNAGSDEDIPF